MTLRDINAAAIESNSSTTDLNDSLKGTASAGLVVQTYCNQVLQQPAIILPQDVINKMPPVNQNLQTAQSNADSYLKNIQPQIIRVVTDVGGYSQQFNSFYMLIGDRLNDWKNGDQSAKEDAVTLLQQLQNAIDERKQSVILVTNSVSDFRTKLNIDISNFNTAVTQGDIIIAGNKGIIADYDRQIGELDKQIAGTAAGVAISGLAVIGGVIAICVGAVGVIAGGAGVPAIIGGVALVVAGGAGLTASSIILANSLKTKSNLIQQKANLNAVLQQMSNVKSSMVQLGDSATAASTQLNNMKNAWDILQGNMGNVLKSLNNARTYSEVPITVQAFLNSANKQWTTVEQSVQTIQQQMTGVKTTVIKDNSGNLALLDIKSITNAARAA